MILECDTEGRGVADGVLHPSCIGVQWRGGTTSHQCPRVHTKTTLSRTVRVSDSWFAMSTLTSKTSAVAESSAVQHRFKHAPSVPDTLRWNSTFSLMSSTTCSDVPDYIMTSYRNCARQHKCGTADARVPQTPSPTRRPQGGVLSRAFSPSLN